MFLDMATLLLSPEKVARVAFREMVDVPPDVGTLGGPVMGGLTAEVAGAGAFVQLEGEFQARLELACHRCGRPFATDQDFRIDETLELVENEPASVEVGDSVWARGQLDVTDLVRQTLLIALPSQILCGCAPLESGPAERIDPRWQKLSGFRPVGPPEES